jgi:hypothetical protein
MLTDLRRHDPVAFHRFLWSNHLAYAASYEVPHRFGASKINPTRHALFDGMSTHLRSRRKVQAEALAHEHDGETISEPAASVWLVETTPGKKGESFCSVEFSGSLRRSNTLGLENCRRIHAAWAELRSSGGAPSKISAQTPIRPL